VDIHHSFMVDKRVDEMLELRVDIRHSFMVDEKVNSWTKRWIFTTPS